MNILHTESSTGWGGQEIRILREAVERKKRWGYETVFAVNRKGKLIGRARAEGFTVYELPFNKGRALQTIWRLLQIIRRHRIALINTHSSLDAWIGGIAARLAGRPIIRTRHLSTPIRKGWNSYLLYNKLVDFVVTTSSCMVPVISEQAKLPRACLKCVPTGIDPQALLVAQSEIDSFRRALNLKTGDILVGTACFVRSWKGIDTLLQTAEKLKERKEIKWVIVGGGYVDNYRPKVKDLGIEQSVIFTGHLEHPYPAIAAMDIFVLLSTAHEGISQASLQAAYLKRPLITTSVGGLPEVCIEGKTGLCVAPHNVEETARAVETLADNPALRIAMGEQARLLVEERFTFERTLDEMHAICVELTKI